MKVAIVTGGSSGIGAATAQELAKRGWQVAITFSKDEKKAKEVAGKNMLAVKGDVAEDADCRRIAKEVLAKWGRIDALVNNAGTTKFVKHADLEGLSAADFERIFRVNVVGPFQMTRACVAAPMPEEPPVTIATFIRWRSVWRANLPRPAAGAAAR